jgi:hypothetical protein
VYNSGDSGVAQIPTVIGLLICEKAIIEEGTKNVTLVNCHTRIKVERFPSDPQRFTLFAVLADGAGEVTLEVGVSRLADDVKVFRAQRRLRFGDKLQEVRFIFRMNNCRFSSAGKYQIDLLADGQYLAHHRIDVSL